MLQVHPCVHLPRTVRGQRGELFRGSKWKRQNRGISQKRWGLHEAEQWTLQGGATPNFLRLGLGIRSRAGVLFGVGVGERTRDFFGRDCLNDDNRPPAPIPAIPSGPILTKRTGCSSPPKHPPPPQCLGLSDSPTPSLEAFFGKRLL